MYILGIDQGIANLGFSILNDEELITYGCITTNSNQSLEKRFFIIYSKIKELIIKHKPSVIACEKLFYTSPGKNKRNKSASIIYTNMITGVLACLAGEFNIELHMFVPSQVKKNICNNGKATKDEIIKIINSKYEIETTKTKYEHICDSISIALTYYKTSEKNVEASSGE